MDGCRVARPEAELNQDAEPFRPRDAPATRLQTDPQASAASTGLQAVGVSLVRSRPRPMVGSGCAPDKTPTHGREPADRPPRTPLPGCPKGAPIPNVLEVTLPTIPAVHQMVTGSGDHVCGPAQPRWSTVTPPPPSLSIVHLSD